MSEGKLSSMIISKLWVMPERTEDAALKEELKALGSSHCVALLLPGSDGPGDSVSDMVELKSVPLGADNWSPLAHLIAWQDWVKRGRKAAGVVVCLYGSAGSQTVLAQAQGLLSETLAAYLMKRRSLSKQQAITLLYKRSDKRLVVRDPKRLAFLDQWAQQEFSLEPARYPEHGCRQAPHVNGTTTPPPPLAQDSTTSNSGGDRPPKPQAAVPTHPKSASNSPSSKPKEDPEAGAERRRSSAPDGEDKVTVQRKQSSEELKPTGRRRNSTFSFRRKKSKKDARKEGEAKGKKKGRFSLFGKKDKAEGEEAADSASSTPKAVVHVSAYSELPESLRKKVENASITPEQAEEHLFVLLNVLHFHTKQIFILHRDGQELKTSSSSSAVPSRDFDTEEAELLEPGDPKDFYKLGRETGKGGFGRVWSAQSRSRDKRKVAIKVLPHVRSKMKRYNLREVRFLKMYPHKNIVKFKCAYKTKGEIWMIMELMSGGTLTEAVKKHLFEEKQIAYVARELLQALAYLHSKSLCHRDVKSGNVMMTTQGQIKLIDFGLCIDLSDEGEALHMVGSPFWMPPEMIRREPHAYPADIWSFAICILELANNQAPHRENALGAMFKVGTVGIEHPLDEPGKWSNEFKDFLSQCLAVDSTERGTAEALLKHPFIGKADTSKSMKKILSHIFISTALEMMNLGV